MGKIVPLERRHLVDTSKDEYHYTQTYAKQGCVKHKVGAQQTKEKDWKAEATPQEQIPKQKHPQMDIFSKKRERPLP
jgi:hypothetical protein